MTYKDLLERLKVMEANAPNSLGDTVTVYDPYEDEFIAVIDTDISGEENDVLDEGHLFLKLKA